MLNYDSDTRVYHLLVKVRTTQLPSFEDYAGVSPVIWYNTIVMVLSPNTCLDKQLSIEFRQHFRFYFSVA